MKRVILFVAIIFATVVNVSAQNAKSVNFKKGDTLIVGDSGILQKPSSVHYPTTVPVKDVSHQNNHKPSAQQGSGYFVENPQPQPQPVRMGYPVDYTNDYRILLSHNDLINIISLLVVLFILYTIGYFFFPLRRRRCYENEKTLVQHFHINGGSGGRVVMDSYNSERTEFSSFKVSGQQKTQPVKEEVKVPAPVATTASAAAEKK